MVRTYPRYGQEINHVDPGKMWSTEKGKMLDDTVTLTKSQLRAILEAVGNTTGLTAEHGPNEHFNYHEDRFEENNPGYLDRTAATNRQTFENVTRKPSNAFNKGASSYSDNNHQSLSRLDQKKRQWEREKAESYDWAPWGKPGGGAPRQTTNRKIPGYPHMDSQGIQQSDVGTGGLPSPDLNHCERAYSGYSQLSNSVGHGRHIPEYLRSSLPFGSNSHDTREEDEQKKRIWQEELKNQHEEQKQKRGELNHWYSDDNGDYPESHCNPPYSNAVSPLSSVATTLSRSYHRGQGILMEPEELSKIEEKRQKALEYQQIIHAQVEDKKRREQEEREKQKREEEKEERRLEEERERLRKQFEEEQRKLKEKQEEKDRKEQALLLALREAQASAEKAKLARKKQNAASSQPQPSLPESRPTTRAQSSRKIESRNSEISELELSSPKGRLPSARNSEQETERWVSSSLLSEPITCSEKATKPQQAVHPVQSGDRQPNSAPLPLPEPGSRESSVQTVRPLSAAEEKSPYIENRLLTPSQWRVKERNAAISRINVWGRSREFGTQTEMEKVDIWPAEEGDSPGSSGSSVSNSSPKHLPRVKHSKPTKASRKAVNQNVDEEKPKWGVNKPEKTFVKMTDRDPHFFRRKKMQELRKQHWEREMATQHSLIEARRSVLSSRNEGTRVSNDRVSLHSGAGINSQFRSGVPWRSESSVLNGAILNSTYTISKDNIGQRSLPQVPSLHKRWSHSTNDIQGKQGSSFVVGGKSEPLPPVRRKWRSQETFFPPPLAPASDKMKAMDLESIPPPRRKWSDQDSFDPERVSLLQSLAHHAGEHSDSEKDKSSSSSSDPIVNPEIVKRRPTPRQDRILQQLSSLRQGLLQKQKELDGWLTRPPRTAS